MAISAPAPVILRESFTFVILAESFTFVILMQRSGRRVSVVGGISEIAKRNLS